MISEVTDNFFAGLETALSLDESIKQFAFSDGTGQGKIIVLMPCLWDLSNEARIVRTHSHGTNYILWNAGIRVVFHKEQVPLEARLVANAFIDVDNVQYRIESAKLENNIYTLELQAFRSSGHAG
jgi:hypothetical protein